MPEWTFPISPIAASRPRVSRHGAYYAGPYKYFRKECAEVIPLVIGEHFVPYDVPLKVDIELFVKRPKKTKLGAPKADIDNYVKAVLDSLNDKLWIDDTIIYEIYAVKQWARPKQNGYFTVGVDKLRRKK